MCREWNLLLGGYQYCSEKNLNTKAQRAADSMPDLSMCAGVDTVGTTLNVTKGETFTS